MLLYFDKNILKQCNLQFQTEQLSYSGSIGPSSVHDNCNINLLCLRELNLITM